MAFQRLAWHRSYAAIFLGLFMLAFPVAFTIDLLGRHQRSRELLPYLVPVLGVPFCLLVIVRGVVGSWSKAQLAVDIPAGQLRLGTGRIVPLAELGVLSIVRRSNYDPNRRHQVAWYRLVAAGLPNVTLYASTFESDTQRRHEALELAVLQSALRPILERPVAGAAFRAPPEIETEVLRIAGSSARARTALAKLAHDHDATIRARATELVASLR